MADHPLPSLEPPPTALSVALAVLLLMGCQSPLPAVPAPSPAVSPVASPQFGTTCVYRGQLPDPACTPGATNPAVTQATINENICKSGWTATVRPSTGYTDALKREQMRAYGVAGQSPSLYEEDHLVPLELGGAPTDPLNLWPEPAPAPNPKDHVENELHALVCSGKMQLADAQQRIARDWTTALPFSAPTVAVPMKG